MSYSRDWNNSTPADHSKLNTGPSSIVAVKVDVSDRLATIVNGFTSGETSPIGILKLPFIAVSAPGTVTDQYQLYGKVVGTKTLLHGKDEDGTEVVHQGFRTGDILLSSNTTTPPSWTDVSATYANKMIRISATALSTGGSDTLSGTTDSHTLTTAEMPAHTHTVDGKTGNYSPGTAANFGRADTLEQNGNITTSSAGSGGGHTHTLTAISCLNAYVSMKAYQKD